MPNHQPKFADRFRESLEQAQARLTSLEEEAQKMVQDVLVRSKATRREMASLIAKVNATEIFDPKTVKQWQGKAKHVSADIAHRVEDLRSRAIAFAGVASREQVDELAHDLDKLSRKIDRLVSGKKAKQ